MPKIKPQSGKQRVLQLTKRGLLTAIVFSLGTNIAHSNSDCAIDSIKKLSFNEQLERYGTCINLMKQEHELLKAQQQIEKMTSGSVRGLAKPEGISPPGYESNISQDKESISSKKYPDAVLSVEGVGEDLVANIAWSNGRMMTVRKGSYLSKNLRVSKVTLNGIELVDGKTSSPPIFIGVGQSGQLNQQTGMPYAYPMQ